MADRPSDTVVRAWARLVRAERGALEQIERQLKAAELPALAWYDILLELERAEPAGLRPFELEERLLLAQYNLSRLLDRIEHARYVERRACEEDGRGTRLFITEAGKAVRRRMWSTYSRAIQAAVGSRLSERQAAQLDELLGALIGLPRSPAASASGPRRAGRGRRSAVRASTRS